MTSLSIQSPNEIFVCDAIDKINLFILRPLANIAGDYLRQSFDKMNYKFEPYLNTKYRYKYIDSNFCTKFEFGNNALNLHIDDKFAIIVMNSDHYMNLNYFVDIMFYDTNSSFAKYNIRFFITVINLNIIKSINSIKYFKKYVRLECHQFSFVSSISHNFTLFAKSENLHSELWNVWCNEIQPAICCFF